MQQFILASIVFVIAPLSILRAYLLDKENKELKKKLGRD